MKHSKNINTIINNLIQYYKRKSLHYFFSKVLKFYWIKLWLPFNFLYCIINTSYESKSKPTCWIPYRQTASINSSSAFRWNTTLYFIYILPKNSSLISSQDLSSSGFILKELRLSFTMFFLQISQIKWFFLVSDVIPNFLKSKESFLKHLDYLFGILDYHLFQ